MAEGIAMPSDESTVPGVESEIGGTAAGKDTGAATGGTDATGTVAGAAAGLLGTIGDWSMGIRWR